MATASELRARVLRALARSPNAPTNTLADMLAFMNAVIREDVCADHDWPFMKKRFPLTLVEDVDTYAVPETAGGLLKDVRMIELRESSDDDWHPLDELTEEELYEASQTTTTGQPHAFGLKTESTIMFRYVPDEAYECMVHTVEFPAALTVTPDTSNFVTQKFPRLVEFGTLARAFAYFEQFQAASYYQGLFQEEKQRVLGVDRRTTAPSQLVLRQSIAAGSRAPRSTRRRGRHSWPVSYD